MQPKLRIYLLLIGTSGILFLVLYKTLSGEEQESESHSKYTSKIDEAFEKEYLSRSKSFVNINALLTVTQPLNHLEKQRMKEAEMHAKIKKNSLLRSGMVKLIDTTLESLNNLPGKSDPIIKHPAVFLNEKVSKHIFVPKSKNVLIERKFVHLDLKGAPPIVNYYKKLFPLLRTLGATGLLIEYEDMFPFYGPLESIAARNAYSRDELFHILELAKLNDLEIIPLIQTFGHMEFILKLSSYQSLREVPSYPQVLCPSNNGTQLLLRQIVDQVIAFHPSIKWLHIGSDEVYYIGECNLCQNKMHKLFMDKEDLFISHVKDISKYIKEKHKVQPIMWDDMFRMIPEETIKKSEIWKYVELMAWQYGTDVELKIPPHAWKTYGKYFSGVWIASAFKGATGPNQYITNISYHLENHVSWLNTIAKYQAQVNFKGFVLTGWQRYDHFAVLCELLPVAIPSLAINLIFLHEQIIDNILLEKTRDILQCDSRLSLEANFTTNEVFCNFPGSNIFKGAQKLMHLNYMLHKFLTNNHVLGWMNNYNIRMLFSSPAHVELGTQSLESLSTNATLLYTFFQNTMPEVYDKYTIDEWLQTFLDPITVKIDKIRTAANNLLKFQSWPRRPLNSGR